MNTYQLTPLAPLVFRSGRPFGVGGRDGANFPWPSAWAGLLRTQYMDDQAMRPPLDTAQVAELRALAAAGPLLACRQGKTLTPLIPKPADALYLADSAGDIGIHALRPQPLLPGCGCDLPAGLLPLQLDHDAPESKPQAGPQWWPLDQLLAWRGGRPLDFNALDTSQPGQEDRTHVALNRATLAADPGQLFQTQGLDFGKTRLESGGYGDADWVMLGRSAADIGARMVAFGGERRLSHLEKLEHDPLALPDPQRTALAQLKPGSRLSVTLATPALFTQGWRPGWLGDDLTGDVPGINGLRLKLIAAAVERWQGISGWDLAQGGAKPARKAVAAGAVYWFEILAAPAGSPEKLWLHPLSDDEQDRRDGFGLAIPHVAQASSLQAPTKN